MRKQILFILSIFFGLTACNLDEDRVLTETEILELQKRKNDSIIVFLDSLNSKSIYVPPLYNEEIIDSTTVSNFFELTKKTDGELKILVNSELISKEIIYIIQKHAVSNADILFLIDKTGSMGDDIDNVKEGLAQIIASIKTFENIRVGIGLYGDKNYDGSDWYVFKAFNTNLDLAQEFIKSIEVKRNGDHPESVYDGFFRTTEENFWQSENKRMVILIGDAPPLEKPLSDYSLDEVVEKATSENVKMNFYPIVVSPSMIEYGNPDSKPRAYEASKLVTIYYPNPSTGLVNINFERYDTYQIQIFDFNGKPVSEENFTGNSLTKEFYDLPNGVYIIRLIDSELRFESIRVILNK